MSLNLLFFGTLDHGAPFLKGLLNNAHHKVVGVVLPAQKQTVPPGPRARLRRWRRAFRGWMHPPETTRTQAHAARIPIWDAELTNPAFADFAARLHPDLFVVASFTRILKPDILALAPRGAINVHPSLLPKYRGADPIFWAMFNNESVTGVTIHWMDSGVDTGPILCQREVEIPCGIDARELTERLIRVGVELLTQTLNQIESGLASRRVQEERQATYFPPASREFRTIHWEDGAHRILRLIRASVPYGGAVACLQGQTVRVIEVEEAEPSPLGTPGEVIRREGRRVEVLCGDARLRLLLAGGAA